MNLTIVHLQLLLVLILQLCIQRCNGLERLQMLTVINAYCGYVKYCKFATFCTSPALI